MFEEIYYTEVEFNKYEVLTINTKDNTYHTNYANENELVKGSVFMSKSIYDSLIIGLNNNGFKEN